MGSIGTRRNNDWWRSAADGGALTVILQRSQRQSGCMLSAYAAICKSGMHLRHVNSYLRRIIWAE